MNYAATISVIDKYIKLEYSQYSRHMAVQI